MSDEEDEAAREEDREAQTENGNTAEEEPTETTAEIDEEVDAEDARVLIGAGKARSIDLRDVEVVDTGHVPGTEVVGEDRSPKETAEFILRGDTDVAIIVVCEDGKRSKEVAAELREDGFAAGALKGGWSKWVSAGNTVQPHDDQEYEGPELTQPGGGGA